MTKSSLNSDRNTSLVEGLLGLDIDYGVILLPLVHPILADGRNALILKILDISLLSGHPVASGVGVDGGKQFSLVLLLRLVLLYDSGSQF